MENNNNDNKKKFGIAIAVCFLLLVVMGGTYAYWTTTKVQEDDNVINATCLDITYHDDTEGITLLKSFPISDESGMATPGYTFTISNNCDGDVAYTVNLESLVSDIAVSDRLSLTVLDTVLDNGTIQALDDYATGTTLLASGVAYDTRTLTTGTLAPNGTTGDSRTYVLRVWVDKNAPTTQMNKFWEGKITVSAVNTTVVRETLASVDKTNVTAMLTYLNSHSAEFEANENQVTSEDICLSDSGESLNCEMWGYSATTNGYGLGRLPNGSSAIANGGFTTALPAYIKTSTDSEFKSVDTINTSAFASMNISTAITIPNTVVTIGSTAFVANQIPSINFGANVEVIGDTSFYQNNLSGTLVIPDSVTTIGVSSFENNHLTSVTIGSSVETIKTVAFRGNELTGYFDIPSNVVTIEGNIVANQNITGFRVYGKSEKPSTWSNDWNWKGVSGQEYHPVTWNYSE